MNANDRASLAWDVGGDAHVVSLAGDEVVVDSSRAWPPGSRPKGKLVRDGQVVWVKVHGSRRDPATGRFRVEGRLLDATRALLDLLAVLTAPGGASPGGAPDA